MMRGGQRRRPSAAPSVSFVQRCENETISGEKKKLRFAAARCSFLNVKILQQSALSRECRLLAAVHRFAPAPVLAPARRFALALCVQTRQRQGQSEVRRGDDPVKGRRQRRHAVS
tara:strand:+ start:25 stop:369 length:345 start_codon:yes stop_codon:yes gene_type:complete